MSTPKNPLSSFRSARYYHVLVMCDRTSTAEALIDADAAGIASPWNRPTSLGTDFDGVLGKRTPIAVTAKDGSNGFYSILVHGSSDADMSITDFKLSSFTAAAATASDQNTSIATEASMSISEPKGIMFLDTLINCNNAMNADAVTACYLLKTFFVGYQFDAESATDAISYITDVSPTMLLLVDVTASYTEQGGVYSLSFVALTNGASRLPQFARAADGITIDLGKGGASRTTVKGALEQLFGAIRTKYQHHYDCVIAVAKNKGIINPTEIYYPVEYVIDVANEYGEPGYFVSDAPMQYKIGGDDCFRPPVFKNGVGGSIEDAIHKILNMSPKLKKDMVDGDGDGKNTIKYEYKIHSTINTTSHGSHKKCVVTYFIKRFESPRGLNISKLFESAVPASDAARMIRENLITFDYIFSGKNIDILEFDIKLNYGLTYLQTATSSNTFKDQLENVASRTTHVSSHSDIAGRTGKVLPVPVFFSPQLRSLVANNTQDPALSVQSAFSMSKHASLETLDASVRIVGNPRLYSSVSKVTRPDSITTVKQIPSPVPELAEADFKHWTSMPALAKINIYMPAHNDELALLTGTKLSATPNIPPDYTKKFWYDGYYYVYGVENEFVDGEFTQVLSMIGIPNGSLLENDGLTDSTEKTAKSIEECYDSKSAYKAVPMQQPSTPLPENITTGQDAKVINSTTGTPSDVVGWATATPDVRQAILDAAAATGIDPRLMAQIAQHESGFNPAAKASEKEGSATGLYQFVGKTWIEYVKKYRPASIPVGASKSEVLKARYDARLNSLMGARYTRDSIRYMGSDMPGDLYLAHFAGRGGAKDVIVACESGKGDALLSDVWKKRRDTETGEPFFDKVKRLNPSIIQDHPTANGLRSWAAISMAITLIPTAVQPTASRTTSNPNIPSTTGTTAYTGPSAATVLAGINGNADASRGREKNGCGDTKTPPDKNQQGKSTSSDSSKSTATKNPHGG